MAQKGSGVIVGNVVVVWLLAQLHKYKFITYYSNNKPGDHHSCGHDRPAYAWRHFLLRAVTQEQNKKNTLDEARRIQDMVKPIRDAKMHELSQCKKAKENEAGKTQQALFKRLDERTALGKLHKRFGRGCSRESFQRWNKKKNICLPNGTETNEDQEMEFYDNWVTKNKELIFN